jgi:cob(I)alamin adenosyltransferase
MAGLFYTGKGDCGASQIGSKKIPKDSPIFEALGDVDELNSLIGLVKSTAKKPLSRKLGCVQETLFIIQAQLAWILFPKFKAPKLTREKTKELEQEIEAIERKVKPERGFIVVGSDPTSAQLDYVRAVSRRAERSCTKLKGKQKASLEMLMYLNRLSSYFFALARNEIHKKNIKEPHPTYQ